MTETSYLGRGQEPIAGKPFGYAHVMERREIRAHLLKRGWEPNDIRLEFRVSDIQMRLNRGHKAKWEARQAAWRAANSGTRTAPVIFSPEELAYIAERFEAANDPISQAIYAKAARL